MSKTTIPPKVKLKLWLKSGGRCQFCGCNELLYRDNLTKTYMNRSYIAHIVADSPGGTRGDAILSPQLAKEFSNLMLLCDPHHRLIDDKSQVDIYTVDLLKMYKREHEERIEYLTGIDKSQKSHILIFKDNIGYRQPKIDYEDARHSILPRYPAQSNLIELDLTTSSFKDDEKEYFKNRQKEISRFINTHIRQRTQASQIGHLSIFALAPIPSLVHFGYEIGELIPSDVYQHHRDTKSWKWSAIEHNFQYIVEEPELSETSCKSVVLNLSLSGTIQPDEIDRVMVKPYQTYKVTISEPNRDYLKSEDQLDLFKAEIRVLLRKIREVHGGDCEIHLFAATPAPVAVSFGQVILPKSDPLIHVYEHNSQNGGFRHALQLGGMT
jgi:SMODS-associated and fused to various effectors sensor domain